MQQRVEKWLDWSWLHSGRLATQAIGTFLAVATFLLVLDWLAPPNMQRYQILSTQVLDSDSQLMRAYLAGDGIFRLKTDIGDVDADYLRMLIAYEDKRFYTHSGVDPLAMVRALGQVLISGEVVSGASTLTMQTARLLEPRPRNFRSKLIEIVRAAQLERRYSKDEILSIYLTLAPYGGNVEGVRAASYRYFGHLPVRLTLAEAALLVALPQSPTRFHPGKHPARAGQARDKVLDRTAPYVDFEASVIANAKKEALPNALRDLPFVAPHLADRLRVDAPNNKTHMTHIDLSLQKQLEKLALNEARRIGNYTSVAILVIETKSRKVITYVGSSDFFDRNRQGQVDLVPAIRSPGSTLKPILYGLAFDRGLAHPSTMVDDIPTQFGDYTPSNFMDKHYGQINLTDALRLSLNVPAVAVLDRLGSTSVTERLRRDGVTLNFGGGDAKPGLALALGGVGTKLEDLVRIFASLADDGKLRKLSYEGGEAESEMPDPLLGPIARWYIGEILSGVRPPASLLPDNIRRQPRGIAYKTGTSYGFRDAWAIGYSGTHAIGVWVGRADGTPSPGHFGAVTAAPILFRAFEHLPPNAWEVEIPENALPLHVENLPPGLRLLGEPSVQVVLNTGARPPRITFPLDDTQILMPEGDRPLTLEAHGGVRPLTWFVNGAPVPSGDHGRQTNWLPDGPGFADIVLVDARGQRAKAHIRLLSDQAPLDQNIGTLTVE